jgi:hypothetical protein
MERSAVVDDEPAAAFRTLQREHPADERLRIERVAKPRPPQRPTSAVEGAAALAFHVVRSIVGKQAYLADCSGNVQGLAAQ